MVNSGSSANLLAMAVMANPLRKNHLKPGDEVLVPAVCWSTSVWPIIQCGFQPVFVDVDPTTMNVDFNDLKRKITPKTKAMVAVHILGNSADMKEYMNIVNEHKLIILEDTCEGLGVQSAGKYLGTHGDFGTYSMYFSHHITTGEGGMVVCKTQEDVDLLRCLRAHGWTRELSNRAELDAAHPDVDSRFLFVNYGYNLRPMDIQAAMGLVQIERLQELNNARISNNDRLIAALRSHPKYSGQITFPVAPAVTKPVWFGFCMILDDKYKSKLNAYKDYLSASKVENRPIVSGNFVRQPGIKLAGVNSKPEEFPGAEKLHHNGLFIGLHAVELPEVQIKQLADILLGFDF